MINSCAFDNLLHQRQHESHALALELVPHDEVILAVRHANQKPHKIRVSALPHAVLIEHRIKLIRPAAGTIVHCPARRCIGVFCLAVANGLKQRFFAFKMVIEAALGEPQRRDDIADRSALISVLIKHFFCGGKDLFSALFSLKHFFTSVVPINSDLIVLSACPQVKKKTACLSATSQRLERML